jgi:hypothetical protein
MKITALKTMVLPRKKRVLMNSIQIRQPLSLLEWGFDPWMELVWLDEIWYVYCFFEVEHAGVQAMGIPVERNRLFY